VQEVEIMANSQLNANVFWLRD